MRWTVVFLLLGCNGAEPCAPSTTRCVGDVAQVCGSDKDWHDVLDCAELSRSDGLPWRCEVFDGSLHTCELGEDAGL